ncbi:MAG: tRNA glutamyl-Q(34) synthetase GluQRS [Novosphingobium sp.]
MSAPLDHAVTRFAPSPNGPLHLGHAYAAVVAHDRAIDAGGRFLLRIEDIDGARSRSDLAEAFRADLVWLGLEFVEVPAQSTRLAQYREAAANLRAMGLLYPCRCSRAEVAAAATLHGPDGPIYPGTCLRNPPINAADPVWRLDVEQASELAGPLEWRDERRGPQHARPELLGDVVLWRRDAPASYHLAATVDDAADGVTVVTRGADLFAATHIHRLLQVLLGLPEPRWHHHALLAGPDGRKLAKRRDAPALTDRRRAGEGGHALADSLRRARFDTGISLIETLDFEA